MGAVIQKSGVADIKPNIKPNETDSDCPVHNDRNPNDRDTDCPEDPRLKKVVDGENKQAAGRMPSLMDPFAVWDHEKVRRRIKRKFGKIQSYCENQPLRIIVCGGAKDGMSSLINNIISALTCKLVNSAHVGRRDSHVTQKYTEYKLIVRGDDEKTTPLAICDTRGFSDSLTSGVPVAAVKAAIMGKLLSEEDMCPKKVDDEWHNKVQIKKRAVSIIFVFDATKLRKGMFEETKTFSNMKTILTFAEDHAIPRAAFLTKCDLLDSNIYRDTSQLYKSISVRNAIQSLYDVFNGVEGNRIFPIVNYTDTHDEVDSAMMVQTLRALKYIIEDIETYLTVHVDEIN